MKSKNQNRRLAGTKNNFFDDDQPTSYGDQLNGALKISLPSVPADNSTQ
jgi:hypothetical protein